ncbi:alpha-amylase [Streptomyces sp. NPDC003247]|uniref:alpha-amylase n=1 Tax=Streptomyces sp. NPDC003247 TaxID=3364677 RepID=UPI0036AE37DA
MRRVTRSTIVVAAAALSVLTGGTAAHAVPPTAAETSDSAPACLEVSADWRYTFVSNTCSSTYTLTISYSDGRDVPCRVADPGDFITFPGYGTDGAHVLGAVLCATAEDG